MVLPWPSPLLVMAIRAARTVWRHIVMRSCYATLGCDESR